MRVIVSDTTSLIVLEGLNALALVCKIFESILIPQAVFNELVAGSPDFAKKLQASPCIELIQLASSDQLENLLLILDQGEAEAITLALEQQLPILIDERKGRLIAQQKGLVVTGFLGLLLLMIQRNVLTEQEAKQLLDQTIKNGFHVSEKLYRQISDVLKLN